MYIFERFRWVYLFFIMLTSWMLYHYYLADVRLSLIFLFSFLPTIIYIGIARQSDVGVKEPRGAITWGVLIGMILIYPAIYLEQTLFPIIATRLGVSASNVAFESAIYFAVFNFLVVAPVEELLKFTGFIFSTRFHKESDLPSDYIIYMIAVSGGFAIYENLVYLLAFAMGNSLPIDRVYAWFLDENAILSLFDFTVGFYIIILRNVAAVPLHLGVGVLMGTRYAKFLKGRSLGVSKAGQVFSLIGMILLPILIHGVYNTFSIVLSIYFGDVVAIVFSVSFVVILNIIAWKQAIGLRDIVKENFLT